MEKISWIIYFLIHFTYEQKFSQNNYYDTYSLNSSTVDGTNLTYPYSLSKELASCPCDLTQNVCDYLCCCDPDCPSSLVAKWSNSTTQNCIKNNTYYIGDSNLCYDPYRVYLFNKQIGITSYYDSFKKLMCIAYDNGPDMGTFYIFTNLTNSQYSSMTTNLWSYTQNFIYRKPLTQVSPYIQANLYSVNSPVIINANNINQTNIDSIFLIYRRGPYGECKLSGGLNYLVDIPAFSCGLMIPQLSQCADYGFEKILLRKIGTFPLPSSTPIVININNIYIRDTVSNILTYSSNNSLTTSLSNSNGICVCSNLPSELSFTFIVNNNTITKILLDMIVIKNTTGTCGSPYNLVQKYEYKFKSSITDDIRSGNPGYNYGSLLRVGYNTTVNGILYFNVPRNGFYVSGRNVDGTCLANSQNNYYTNYDSPLIFGNNMIYSCFNTYNITNFQTFCTGKEWNNFLIFQMLQKLQKVGIFGNSNYTNLNDFVNVTNKLSNSSTFVNNTCTFPGNLIMDIVYGKSGTGSNPQKYVIAVNLTSQNQTYYFEPSVNSITVTFNAIINYVLFDDDYFTETRFSPFSQPLINSNVGNPFAM